MTLISLASCCDMRVLSALLVIWSCTACSIPRWPVSGPVTSPYGLRLRGLSPQIHRGIDVFVPVGTPVQAMKNGKVVFAGEQRGYGLVVILEHGPKLRTVYAHLSEISVKQGDDVHGKQVIALSGQTGDATGPHLHFEIQRWGAAEDPVLLLGGMPGR